MTRDFYSAFVYPPLPGLQYIGHRVPFVRGNGGEGTMRLSPKSIVVSMAALATMLTGCTSKATQPRSPLITPVVMSSSPAPSATPTAASESPMLSSTPPVSSTPKASPKPKPSIGPTHSTSSPPTPTGIVLQNGSKNTYVTQLQTWLYQSKRGVFYGGTCNFDQNFGPHTLQALENWQKATSQPTTGKITVGSTQWQMLQAEATANRLLAGVDPRSVAAAKANGLAIDGSKSPSCVRVLQADPTAPQGVKIVVSISASYAGQALGTDHQYHNYVTPNGTFRLYYRDPLGANAYSSTYFHAPMPWAVYFNGGVAFHYDGLSPSHGCVHIPSMDIAHYLYTLPLGTTVVIHS